MGRKNETVDSMREPEIDEIEKDEEISKMNLTTFFENKPKEIEFDLETVVLAILRESGLGDELKPDQVTPQIIEAQSLVIKSPNSKVPSWYIADVPNTHGTMTCDAKREGGARCGAQIPMHDLMTISVKMVGDDMVVETKGSRCGADHFRFNQPYNRR